MSEISRSEASWYTIKDAAEYLDVSQATIFRWMKQGVLSFYKVGSSTRFTRESLDAVVEKITGEKEAERARVRCSACGHHGLVDGRMQGVGRIYFRPAKTRFWTMEEALVPVEVRACPACGFIQLHTDAAKLNRLMKEPVEEDTEIEE